ncbi:hypothetical protein AMTRI_Chr12g268840 [Amborella trichopoda]
MKGMPYNLQSQGVQIQVTKDWRKPVAIVCSNSSSEPTSVLDLRRSPSPTSTSTLSSSLGGGSVTPDPVPNSEASGSKREEWVSEFQAMELPPSSSSAANTHSSHSNSNTKPCLNMEDWEAMLMESASSPAHPIINSGDTGPGSSLMKWIMGEIEEPKLTHFDEPMETGFGDQVLASGFSFPEPINPSLPAVSFPRPSNSPILSPSSPVKNQNPNPPPNRPPPPFLSPPSPAKNIPPPSPAPPFLSPPLPVKNNAPTSFPLQQSPPSCFSLQNAYLPASTASANLVVPNPLFYQQQFQQLHLEQMELPPQKMEMVEEKLQLPPHLQSQLFMNQGSGPNSPMGFQNSTTMPRQSPPFFHPLQSEMALVMNGKQRGACMRGMGGDREESPQQLQQHQLALVDQLLKAAELVEAGNAGPARAILARLNHQLSPLGNPLHRAAFYFKQALLSLLCNPQPPHQLSRSSSTPSSSSSFCSANPFEIVHKIGAFKAFSEIFPFSQFSNFTCNQALLESLDDASLSNPIHIIDFEIGFGGQWSSFMQELAVKLGSAPPILLKITAVVPSAHDPIEMSLVRENLYHFARDSNIHFEFGTVHFESLDPTAFVGGAVVNFPIGAHRSFPGADFLSLLRLVKAIHPKIVVSTELPCDRIDASFFQHFLLSLESFSIFLDSLESACLDPGVLAKIERFFVQPKIESVVLSRHRIEKLPPWRTLFASAGFAPITLSNFTESQAQEIMKRVQVEGFHVEKRHSMLVLCWQNKELLSASAWRC